MLPRGDADGEYSYRLQNEVRDALTEAVALNGNSRVALGAAEPSEGSAQATADCEDFGFHGFDVVFCFDGFRNRG
jgi:hypothetical protein